MTILPPLAVDARALKDLGFVEVFDLLRALCRTPFGREALDDDVFPTDAGALQARVQTALEARDATARKVAPDFGGLREVRHILDASEKGVVLAAADILDVARTVDALGRLRDVVTFQDEAAPGLVALAEHLADERRFSKRVFRSFDDAGQLTDDASPELSTRRARVRALRADAQEKLVDLVREFGDLDLLRDRNFTIRNDRYVLPVKSEFQGRVDGIVHDASQTHQTVFIEPRALLQLGNRIKIARADVVEEEQRILRELSLEIDELGPRLARDLKVAGALEAAFARGAFAHATDGVALVPGGRRLVLRRARHPLLAWMRARAIAEGRAASAVTPNDLRLDEARCLVVSGPNAGGKTVALKTIGLLSLLARAGVPVPVAEGSTVPAWAGVFVAIGDEQSLEGGFSSFSGHLVAVQRIVADNARVLAGAAAASPTQATETMATTETTTTEPAPSTTEAPQSLVLLDELMSGTDPAQGAALAQAVLEDLVDTGAVVVVTTHYDRLKALALAEAQGTGARRFRNASVGVDRHGRPTFVLALDEVGTSNALDAARRFGLAERTVERAVALLAPEQKELHALLRALAEQKQALGAELEAASAERARFADETARLERRLVDVEAEKTRLRAEGKRAFLDELAAARQKVRDAIETTKRGDARALNDASQTLKQLDEATRAELAPKAMPTSALLAPARVAAGDVVELATMPGVRLTVVEVDGDDVVVARGPVRTRAPLASVRAPGPEPVVGRGAAGTRSPRKARAEAPAGPEPRTSDNSLDVRGQRADDALELVDAFLDKLLRTNHGSGWVLHGHGGGALKKAVRGHLQKSRYVRHSGPGPLDDGGDAWTVIELDPDARL
jgi:DNA mismatch repair protein MutS2